MNRLLISVIGFLSLSVVAVAMAIYAMVARPQAAGVTLSVVGGASACNEYADVSCVISNGTSNAISFFKVYDDGFGCTLEWQEGGNWTTSGVTWCATGRDIVKLNAAETYSFKTKVPLNHREQRLSVEYWDGKPLLSAPKQVKSEPFVCVPTNCPGSVRP